MLAPDPYLMSHGYYNTAITGHKIRYIFFSFAASTALKAHKNENSIIASILYHMWQSLRGVGGGG